MAEPPFSSRSSVEPSSCPSSPSSSPVPTPPDQPKKRTRASKPKNSPGRTCDGYDQAVLARPRPVDSGQNAERARAEFVRTCEWNETLRSMRRIEDSIDGTDTEKRLFARFRAATADGVAAHLCPFSAFWRTLTPATCCQDEAIKHAVVALAAAHQLFQYPNEPVIDGFTRGDLKVFTIQQYNRSIELLQSHAAVSTSESIRVTLVCCLAFIALETLRGNHDVAVNHLVNGLRILQTLPDSAFVGPVDGSLFVNRPEADSLHMLDVVQLFAQFELAACFFTRGVQPVISSRGYCTRRFDDGASSGGPFTDAAQARSAISCFLHDAVARLYEIAAFSPASGNEPASIFWSDPAQQRQQDCLLARSARLDGLIAEYLSSPSLGDPDSSMPALSDLYLDLLYFRCAELLLRNSSPPVCAATNPNFDTTTLRLPSSILHLTSLLLSASSPTTITPPGPHRPLTHPHTRLLGPLCLAATHAPDGPTRAAAITLLARLLTLYPATPGGAGFVLSSVSAGRAGGQQQQQQLQQRQPQPPSQLQGQEQGQGGGDGGSGQLPLTERTVASLLQEIVDREQRREVAAERRRWDGTGCWWSSSWWWCSAEVPRALVGAGCLPLLWDALLP
ncbi:9c2755a0-e03a-4548-b698-75b5c6006bf3 [Thermothielavioides terrestris]|uniref:9c2755a0-e03a-4548-b698-75b5c6006bf3 n=1 Tax=Thermothielavioides terrestris TaxID=2587410 RepID=A0A3S4AV79_9PEZI|nr:9c2755a0-e03a-4548-b698-75b5c6006bf3 [Thermothielavioides terrestris]